MTAIVSFEDGVKARIKDIVAELIPEERWMALVTSAVQQFERDDLPKLVKTEMHARYKKAIEAEFSKPIWADKWGEAGIEASEAVKQIAIDSAPLILADLIGSSLQNAMSQLKYAVQNNQQFFRP